MSDLGGWTDIKVDGTDEEEDELTIEFEGDEEDGEQAKEEEKKKEPVKKSEAVDEDDDEFGQLGKRAQKRIRGLIKKTKEKDEQIAKLVERLEALEQRTVVSEVRGRSEGTRRELQSAYEAAEKEFMDAHDEGDKVKLAKAQNKLLEAKLKLAKLDEFDQGFEEEVKKGHKKEETTEAAPGLHKEVDRWLKKNPHVASNRVLLSAAGAIAAELEEEGYGPDDPEYFEEVETRMKSMGLWKDEEAASKPNRVVNGQSRTTGKKSVVKLTAEEKALCHSLGIDPVEYAKEKIRVEKEQDSLGYTTINVARRKG